MTTPVVSTGTNLYIPPKLQALLTFNQGVISVKTTFDPMVVAIYISANKTRDEVDQIVSFSRQLSINWTIPVKIRWAFIHKPPYSVTPYSIAQYKQLIAEDPEIAAPNDFRPALAATVLPSFTIRALAELKSRILTQKVSAEWSISRVFAKEAEALAWLRKTT